MIFTDLVETKSLLDIHPDDKSEDKKLTLLTTMASAWIEELLNRPGFSYASRTEYYNGTGTPKLLLRSRPVYTTPTIQVFLDESGLFGATSGSFDSATTALTYGDDFGLWIDQENGTSRSGILIRKNNFWLRPSVRERGYLSPYVGTGYGTIKVVYTAGYRLDDLPTEFRMACILLVARLRMIFPWGVEFNSDSYEDKSMSVVVSEKSKLLALIRPLIMPFRNWSW